MPTPTIFEGINPRGTQTFIPCKDVSAFPRSEQAVLGAVNVLRRFKGDDTINGVSFTADDDDFVTLSNSIALGYVSYDYASRSSKQLKIPVGTWKIIPRKTGSDDSRFVIGSGNTADGTGGTYEEWARCNNEPVTFTVDATKSNRYVTAAIILNQGQAANSTWQPMIVPADFPDNVNYSKAMTNKELTEIKTGTVSEYTNSYASFNTSSAFLVSRAGVKQLYMFVTISTVASSDDWIQIATLSEAPTKAITGINVPWDSALGSARSFVYQIDTSGKVYIRAKAAMSSIISETFI